MPDAARWLDREALAAHISARVDELPRLLRAGKLPAPSYHFGPKSPRWWSADVDEMLGRKVASPQRQGAAALAAKIEAKGRTGRQAQTR